MYSYDRLRYFGWVILLSWGDEEEDPCESSPCEHGSCSAEGTSYECACEDGCEGDDCELDIDGCEDEPCEHGGICEDGVDSYSCDCTGTGYEGSTCEAALVQQLALPPEASSCDVVGVSDGGTVIAANCQTGGGQFWGSLLLEIR